MIVGFCLFAVLYGVILYVVRRSINNRIFELREELVESLNETRNKINSLNADLTRNTKEIKILRRKLDQEDK